MFTNVSVRISINNSRVRGRFVRARAFLFICTLTTKNKIRTALSRKMLMWEHPPNFGYSILYGSHCTRIVYYNQNLAYPHPHMFPATCFASKIKRHLAWWRQPTRLVYVNRYRAFALLSDNYSKVDANECNSNTVPLAVVNYLS